VQVSRATAGESRAVDAVRRRVGRGRGVRLRLQRSEPPYQDVQAGGRGSAGPVCEVGEGHSCGIGRRAGAWSMRAPYLLALALVAGSLPAQQRLAPTKSSGATVTPAFEGWYKNPDGTFSISFGYYNRNSEEMLEIPVGPDNFISPGPANQNQ